MTIAVLGWGSLIWCPGNLRIKTKWRTGGPRLPIEFARISQDGRLTLVIHPGSADQPTYWALSEFATAQEARANLRERENSSSADIHYVHRDGSVVAPPGVATTISEWLARQRDLQAAIWTGLPSNWMEKRGRDFTPRDAVVYLSELESQRDRAKTAYDRAREYLTNAPPLVETEVRLEMRARGWENAPLPTILFESPPWRPNAELP